MLDLEGWMRERLGRTVNKTMLLRNVGTFYEPVKESTNEAELQNANGADLKKVELRKVVKWRVVAQRYFGAWDTFWQIGGKKGRAYELKLENEAYGRGETHVQFLDFDTGDSLNFTGRVTAARDPVRLNQAVDVKVVKAFADRVKGSGFIVVWFAVGFMVGGLLLFMIGQNWEGISAAISHIGATATPTPPPTFLGVP